MQLVQLLHRCHARREERRLHRAPSHRAGIRKTLEHPKAGGGKFLVRPLKDSVGESRGAAQTPSSRSHPLQHPGEPQSPLPGLDTHQPPERGDRGGHGPFDDSRL